MSGIGHFIANGKICRFENSRIIHISSQNIIKQQTVNSEEEKVKIEELRRRYHGK